ncbi:hypothetical protein EH233_15985 [Anabaena sp. YBS01]|nr:hypothetical protein EH233_15985 [Anabaena sp. YBS01]
MVVVDCHWSLVISQLSVVSCQLSVVSCQLSVVFPCSLCSPCFPRHYLINLNRRRRATGGWFTN